MWLSAEELFQVLRQVRDGMQRGDYGPLTLSDANFFDVAAGVLRAMGVQGIREPTFDELFAEETERVRREAQREMEYMNRSVLVLRGDGRIVTTTNWGLQYGEYVDVEAELGVLSGSALASAVYAFGVAVCNESREEAMRYARVAEWIGKMASFHPAVLRANAERREFGARRSGTNEERQQRTGAATPPPPGRLIRGAEERPVVLPPPPSYTITSFQRQQAYRIQMAIHARRPAAGGTFTGPRRR